jgi:hypothetical protein
MHSEFWWGNLLETVHLKKLRRKWDAKIKIDFGDVCCEERR